MKNEEFSVEVRGHFSFSPFHSSFFPFHLLIVMPLVIAVFFAFLLPYGASLGYAFRSGGKITVWENSSLLRVTFFTVKQAFLSVLVALAIGLPGAWFLSSTSKLSPLFRTISAIPFAMPSILVVLGFVLFFGNSGWLNRFLALFPGAGQIKILYRSEAIILAHGFFNFPLVIRLAGDGLARARKTYTPAASTMGASPFFTAITVLLPLSFPAILSACLLVFLYSFTSFAVVLVLGGGPATTTLPVEIYRYGRIFLDYRNAGALAIVETLIAVSVFLAYVFYGKRSQHLASDAQERVLEGRRESVPMRVFHITYGIFAALFVLGPLVSVILESLLTRSSRSAVQVLSFVWWRSLGDNCLPSLSRSLALAFSSATLSCLLAVSGAISVKTLELRGGRVDSAMSDIFRFFAVAPIVSSGIVLGLGVLALYGSSFSRSPWALVMLHAVIALPFSFNSVSEGFRETPLNTINAAQVSGAGPLRALLTTALPLLLPRIRSAWAFAAALSLGELNTVMMLGIENWETLPLYIYRAAGAYRYGAACAAGSLLMLGCAACFLLSEWGR